MNVYCDESRYTNPFEQYFLIGGVSLPRDQKEQVEARLKQVRRKFGFMPELKWTNVTEAKLPYLNELLQVFFSSDLEFRAIIIDKSKIQLNAKKQPAELTFYKFYYLLLKGLAEKNKHYYVFVDERTKSKEERRLGELQRYLSDWLIKLNSDHSAQTKTVEAVGLPIEAEGGNHLRQVQEIKSEESVFLQLLDLLMGAVGYYWNGFRGSEAKTKFINTLTNRLQKPNLKFSSQLYDRKWNQFVWEPRD